MQPAAETYHVPVLLRQTLQALAPRPDGVYLDGTAGGGGHAYEMARRLTTGHLYALDRDPDAVEAASRRLQGLPATVVQANYTEMAAVLQRFGVDRLDGVLLDIGVSSHQLDTPSRGFSFHHDAPLDMRMSQTGKTAADLVNTLSADELARIFWNYGEDRFSRQIARAIVARRETAPITTTAELSEIVKGAVPAAVRRKEHPARQIFQALRIAVNGELDCLSEGLDTAFSLLRPGGRLAVITFHSLEDRLVKQRFAAFCQGCICPPECPVCICGRTPAARAISRKPMEAEEQELRDNPRSRSAKLRCVEKLHEYEAAAS